MANRQLALLSGLGSPDAVLAAIIEDNSDKGYDYSDLTKAVSLLKTLNCTVDGRPVVRALICSLINSTFATDGWLWFVNENGEIDRKFYGERDGRSVLINLIAD